MNFPNFMLIAIIMSILDLIYPHELDEDGEHHKPSIFTFLKFIFAIIALCFLALE